MVTSAQKIDRQSSAPGEPKTVAVALPIGLKPVVSREQFEAIVQANRDLRLELSAQGELIIMPPAGSGTGHRNSTLSGQFYVWRQQHKDLGLTFDSSTGFTLPDGSIVSPDASWVAKSRWDALTPEEQEGYAPLCPDVVAELRSKSDRLTELREKMQTYVRNGAQLGVIINPQQKTVEIYRPGRAAEVLSNPKKVNLDEAMSGFELNVSEIWSP